MPRSRPVKRLSDGELAELRAQLIDLLDRGWIQHSTAGHAAAVVFARKPDGSWRICYDYRGLNAITRPAVEPLPHIDALLDGTRGSRFFTKLDLASSYHQLRVRAADRWKTSFRSHAHRRPRPRLRAEGRGVPGTLRSAVPPWAGRDRPSLYPAGAGLRAQVLRECHDGPLGGHFGRSKTGSLVRRLAFWVGQDVDVAEYVRSCQTCQRTKAEHGGPRGLLHPLPLPSRRGGSITSLAALSTSL